MMNENEKHKLNVIRNAIDILIDDEVIKDISQVLNAERVLYKVYNSAEEKIFNDINEDMKAQNIKDEYKYVIRNFKLMKVRK